MVSTSLFVYLFLCVFSTKRKLPKEEKKKRKYTKRINPHKKQKLDEDQLNNQGNHPGEGHMIPGSHPTPMGSPAMLSPGGDLTWGDKRPPRNTVAECWANGGDEEDEEDDEEEDEEMTPPPSKRLPPPLIRHGSPSPTTRYTHR